MNNTIAKDFETIFPKENMPAFDAVKFDQILFDLASKAGPFSGERYTPGAGVQICYEHLHRYLFATQFLKLGDVVLDLGCGVGYGSILLAAYGLQVIAIDIDPESTAMLQEIAKIHHINNLTVLTGDVAQLDQLLQGKTQNIGLVVCHEVIEHLSESMQRDLVSKIGTAKAPFTAETTFLVSTPDKELYDQQSEAPNPFHAHELSAKEFETLLKENFKFLRCYEQNTGSVNYLRTLGEQELGPVSFFQLGWQSKEALIPGLSKPTFPAAEYIYAVARNTELPKLPHTSVLVDASNQYVRERLSIAAKELRENKSELAVLARVAGQIRTELKIESSHEVQPIADEIAALNDLVKRQAEKIKNSQKEAERIGYELSLELNSAHIKVRELDHLIFTLKPWHAMAGTLLGATPESAASEVHRLKSYEAAMRSPGHRLVTLIGKVSRILLPVALIKRTFKFLQALSKA